MTVFKGVAKKVQFEKENKNVLVGISIDKTGHELLDWALVKVAEPGDCVVAVHACRDSKENQLFDGYLEAYKGLCSVKQIDLKGRIVRGSSVRKVLVREAKRLSAVALIVGISRQNAFRGSVSTAKYCAKKLSSSTTVLAVHNGKVVFQKSSNNQLQEVMGDPRPSCYPIGNLSPKENQHGSGDADESEIEKPSLQLVQNSEDGFRYGGEDDGEGNSPCSISSPIEDLPETGWPLLLFHEYKEENSPCSSSSLVGELPELKPGWPLLLVHEHKEENSPCSSSSLIGELPESKPGWPLLLVHEYKEENSPCPSSSLIRELPGWPLLLRPASVTPEARNISVVQWVMNLPNRPLPSSPQTQVAFNLDKTEKPLERAISCIDEQSNQKSLSACPDLELHIKANSPGFSWFSYKELKSLTSQFSSENLIGQGSSSRVYKGWLPNAKPVAVKILKSSKEAWKDFILEVDIISSLKHKYVRPLIGVCVQDSELITVYDFLSEGTLEENLHGKKNKRTLSWEVRFKVAVGVAEALNYLHNCSRPVIHRDVKSSNILLSDDFQPQLSDFGLAIWAPVTSSYVTYSDVAGTFGYLAPEYFMYGKVSNKIDVYSFGVVLLELLSGRKPIGAENPKGQESLVMWAKPILESGDPIGILDPNLAGKFDKVLMRRMVLAATLCITRAARIRPQMSEILKLLKGEKDVEIWLNSHDDIPKELDNEDDDEVYPDSSAESHLGAVLLDVDDDTISFSSLEQNKHHSLEDYMKGRWSRSSSFS